MPDPTRRRGLPGFRHPRGGKPAGRKVKIADIEDNINVLRLEELFQKDLERVKKYHEAWTYLTNPQEHD